jgi:hypothetical protein
VLRGSFLGGPFSSREGLRLLSIQLDLLCVRAAIPRSVRFHWRRNVDLLSIAFAVRLTLRLRLTLGRKS